MKSSASEPGLRIASEKIFHLINDKKTLFRLFIYKPPLEVFGNEGAVPLY